MPSGPLPTGITVSFQLTGLRPPSITVMLSEPMFAVKIVFVSWLSRIICVVF